MNLRDARVLLLEDDVLISIDAEDMLLGLGVRSVCVSHTLADAESRIEREPIDAAILDIRIGSGRSDPVALTLAARGIPFIFTSGYGQACDLPEAVAAVPIVGKPYASAALVAAFAELARGR